MFVFIIEHQQRIGSSGLLNFFYLVRITLSCPQIPKKTQEGVNRSGTGNMGVTSDSGVTSADTFQFRWFLICLFYLHSPWNKSIANNSCRLRGITKFVLVSEVTPPVGSSQSDYKNINYCINYCIFSYKLFHTRKNDSSSKYTHFSVTFFTPRNCWNQISTLSRCMIWD